MRIRTIQIVAGLLAAVFFVLAFMAAGVFVASAVFMALGLAAIGWLALSLIRQVRRNGHRRRPA